MTEKEFFELGKFLKECREGKKGKIRQIDIVTRIIEEKKKDEPNPSLSHQRLSQIERGETPIPDKDVKYYAIAYGIDPAVLQILNFFTKCKYNAQKNKEKKEKDKGVGFLVPYDEFEKVFLRPLLEILEKKLYEKKLYFYLESRLKENSENIKKSETTKTKNSSKPLFAHIGILISDVPSLSRVTNEFKKMLYLLDAMKNTLKERAQFTLYIHGVDEMTRSKIMNFLNNQIRSADKETNNINNNYIDIRKLYWTLAQNYFESYIPSLNTIIQIEKDFQDNNPTKKIPYFNWRMWKMMEKGIPHKDNKSIKKYLKNYNHLTHNEDIHKEYMKYFISEVLGFKIFQSNMMFFHFKGLPRLLDAYVSTLFSLQPMRNEDSKYSLYVLWEPKNADFFINHILPVLNAKTLELSPRDIEIVKSRLSPVSRLVAAGAELEKIAIYRGRLVRLGIDWKIKLDPLNKILYFWYEQSEPSRVMIVLRTQHANKEVREELELTQEQDEVRLHKFQLSFEGDRSVHALRVKEEQGKLIFEAERAEDFQEIRAEFPWQGSTVRFQNGELIIEPGEAQENYELTVVFQKKNTEGKVIESKQQKIEFERENEDFITQKIMKIENVFNTIVIKKRKKAKEEKLKAEKEEVKAEKSVVNQNVIFNEDPNNRNRLTIHIDQALAAETKKSYHHRWQDKKLDIYLMNNNVLEIEGENDATITIRTIAKENDKKEEKIDNCKLEPLGGKFKASYYFGQNNVVEIVLELKETT